MMKMRNQIGEAGKGDNDGQNREQGDNNQQLIFCRVTASFALRSLLYQPCVARAFPPGKVGETVLQMTNHNNVLPLIY